jgi:GT2 family glycosyltransferase
MSTPAPRVGVVIVNYNAGEYLTLAVESLLAQTAPPHRIVVVDNASTDGSTAGIAELHPSVELVALQKNLGFAAGNNLGVSRCLDCEFVALLNPDAFPEPAWLETLLTAADRHPEFAVFGSRLLLYGDDRFLDGTGDCYHVNGLGFRRDTGAAADVERPTGESFSACAAAALYRHAAFAEVGGFDESFFCYYEDTDLAFRLRLAGHRCLYVSDAVARHVGSATAGAFSEFTVYHSARNQVWAYVKNMPGPLFWLYLPQHVLMNVLTVVAYLPRRKASAALAGKRDALRGLPRVLRQRRRIQAGRRVGPSEIRRSLARGLGVYFLPFVLRARARRQRSESSTASETTVASLSR